MIVVVKHLITTITSFDSESYYISARQINRKSNYQILKFKPLLFDNHFLKSFFN